MVSTPWKDNGSNLANPCKSAVKNPETNPAVSTRIRVVVQCGTLIFYILIMVVTYISYDAISIPHWDWVEMARIKSGQNPEVLAEELLKILRSETGRLSPPKHFPIQTFSVGIFTLATSHPWPFLYGAWFVFSIVAFISFIRHFQSSETGSHILGYSATEAGLVCSVSGVILLNFFYTSEKSSRASFKAMRRQREMQQRLDKILTRLVPPGVIHEMWERPPDTALPSHMYRCATVVQSDLCGFTKFASTLTPQEVVAFISDLFGRFDDYSGSRGIWKVETVGDAYIAAQAELPLTPRNSALNVLAFGQDMVRAVHDWSREHGVKDVACRVGIHHGACIGGVVGTTCQRYHLFGGLMTVVDILESTSKPSRVHVSLACRERVDQEIKSLETFDGEMEFTSFVLRHETVLITSKDGEHSYDDVGGRTYFAEFLGESFPAYPIIESLSK